MAREIGDNAHGFDNEDNMVDVINNGIRNNNLNLNLKEFLKYICENEGLEFSKSLNIRAKKEINNKLKQDFYIYFNGRQIAISLKVGSGNSVHQEKCEDFIKYIKEFCNATDEICDLWRFFLWADGTLDGTGSLEKDDKGIIKSRFTATQFKELYPQEREKMQSFIKENEKQLIERFLFVGKYNSKVDYIYHGTPIHGSWISKDKILEFQLKNSDIGVRNQSCFYVGKMTMQAWNVSRKGTKSGEKKRGQLQIKYGKMLEHFSDLMAKEKLSIGTFEGDAQEFNLSKFLNTNKAHKFWNVLLKDYDNSNCFMVTVTMKPKSHLSNKKVFPKSDAYIIESFEITDKFLLEREYLITEKDIEKLNYKIIPNTGVSIKLKNSTNFTIQKFTKDSFIKAFSGKTENVEELLYGLLVYSNLKKINLNKVIAKDLNINYERFINKMEQLLDLTYGDNNRKEFFDNVRTISQQQLYDIIIDNPKLHEAIFLGKHWFDDPYYAEYMYVFGDLIENVATENFSITTGSGRSKGKYTIEIKPKN